MSKTKASLDRLIIDIHESALAPENWKHAVAQISSFFRADKALLLTPGSSNVSQMPFVVHGGIESSMDQYVRYYHEYDPWVIGARQRGLYRTGEVVVDDEVYDRGAYKTSLYFNEFARTMDLNRGVAVCVVGEDDRSQTPPAALSLYRGIGSEGFAPSDAHVLRRLAPHLTLAVRNHWRWVSLQREMSVVTTALDSVSAAVYGVSRCGHLAFANKSGEHELAAAAWLEVIGGRLCPSRRLLEHHVLEVALARLRRGHGFSLHLQSASATQPAVISGAPYRPVSESALGRTVSALIWLIPMQFDGRPVSVVAELFRLTPAEKRLLDRLATGDELRGAARVLGIAENTARRQLKSIFAKTGRRRQSELLTLLSRVATLRFSA